jgi:uncharacterized membrane protein (UPF0136 family)
MKQSYLTERDRQLSKPLITGTVLVVYLVFRFVSGTARAAEERSMTPLVLTLLGVAIVLVWYFGRKGRWR